MDSEKAINIGDTKTTSKNKLAKESSCNKSSAKISAKIVKSPFTLPEEELFVRRNRSEIVKLNRPSISSNKYNDVSAIKDNIKERNIIPKTQLNASSVNVKSELYNNNKEKIASLKTNMDNIEKEKIEPATEEPIKEVKVIKNKDLKDKFKQNISLDSQYVVEENDEEMDIIIEQLRQKGITNDNSMKILNIKSFKNEKKRETTNYTN